MKMPLTLGILLALAGNAWAQGSLLFINRIVGSVEAPVFYAFGAETGRADNRFMAQLYAGPVGGTLQPTGDPLPFRDLAGAGYINSFGVDTTRLIPGVAEGGSADCMLVAWPTAMGSTYAEAKAGGIRGESAVLTIPTGGGLNPPLPLAGLQSFTITASNPDAVMAAMAAQAAGGSVPEPSAHLLMGLGSLIFLVRRRG